METKIISTYSFSGTPESYDSGIPIELFEFFTKLKEELKTISNGQYECTPIIFDPTKKGVTTGIYEYKNNNCSKSNFGITISKIYGDNK